MKVSLKNTVLERNSFILSIIFIIDSLLNSFWLNSFLKIKKIISLIRIKYE